MKKNTPLIFISVFVIITLLDLSCRARRKPEYMRGGIHGGCCIAGGSPVMMGDGSTKLIENLKVHDTIMGYDRVKNKFVPSVVEALFSTQHEGFVRINFTVNEQRAEGRYSLTLTQDHPVWVKTKGWCSDAPEMTKRIQGMSNVFKYAKGDSCYSYQEKLPKEISITGIEPVKGIIKAYTVVSLQNKLDCFVVNGIVVGVEPRSMEQGGE
jgi:hypothetical protein